MIKDITIGQYFPGDSFIHKLDPRTKIIISMIFIAILFITNNVIGYIALALCLAVVIFVSKVPPGYIFRGLKPIVYLIVLTVVLNLFMNKGPDETPLFAFKFIVIYMTGVKMAVFLGLRLIYLIIGTSILTLTTFPMQLTDGIEMILRPIGRNIAHELAMMMTIALRFIPTLTDETDKIMKAQKSRGANFETGSLVDKGKAVVPLIVPLFISSFRRADELAMAMESRCYRGAEGRTRMNALKVTGKDYIAYLFITVITILLILIRIY